jgi:AraC-like DNA-binding protein
MTVVRARGLALQVHEEMRRRIAAGEFPPGTAVVIADIAKQLGVSATSTLTALTPEMLCNFCRIRLAHPAHFKLSSIQIIATP